MNCAADTGPDITKMENSGRCLLTFEAVRRLGPELTVGGFGGGSHTRAFGHVANCKKDVHNIVVLGRTL